MIACDLGPLWEGDVPPAATALTKHLEAFSAIPYDDNGSKPGGTWTIGFGSTRDIDGKPVSQDTPPISMAMANTLLQRDMLEAAVTVHRYIKVLLHAAQASALISWVYNLGEPALLRSSMLVVLNNAEFDRVPPEMGRWILQAGVPLVGLRRRRWAEGGIFLGMDPDEAIRRAWADIHEVSDWPAYSG